MLATLATIGIAAQLAIVAHAPDTVNSCQAVDITVAVSASGRVVPQLTPPSFYPFDLLRHSARPYVQYGPGPRIVAEYRYTVAVGGVGRFTIPPFEARIGAERVVSAPLTLTVRESRGRGVPAVVARARIDTSVSPEILETIGSRADTVYVGQQATYEVAVFLNGPLRERLRHNPTFYPPEMQAMLAYDLPVTSTARRVGSQCFDALVYRRALFPLAAGRLAIPPAQLVYRTSLSPYMYRAEESHELSTDSVMLVAVEPPAEGRPAEYNGAVGDVRVDATIDSVAPRVGDPMLFTVRVTGSGNVKLFPRPIVRVPWAGLVAADERVSVDSGSARVAGAKEFDWVLTPRIAGEFDLPPVRYGYFDPAKRRYDIAVAPGSRLRIRDGALASGDTGDVRPVLGIRATYRGPASPPLHSRGAFWLAMALAPLPALVTRARRRTLAPKATRAAENPMRALIAASGTDDPVVLRRHYVRSLARRLGCNPEDFTHPGALERALRRAGVSDDTSARAETLLRELDSAAYDRDTHIPRGAGRRAASIARAVDAEALARAELPFWLPLIVAAASLALAAGAIAADSASTHFSRGVSSYMRDDYPAARDAFGHAVTMQPASADAWANYGTASFTLNDTAAAVLGWRQALAIEPGSRELHERMALVRIEGPGAPGWVPALPKNLTVWLFAVLWVAAWALAWGVRDVRLRARIAWAERLPIPLAAVALVIGVLAIEVETRISGSRLAVVRQPIALSSDPALGLDRGPALGTGEIVAVQARRGGWTRVSATAERDGWVATSSLHLIDERRVPRD